MYGQRCLTPRYMTIPQASHMTEHRHGWIHTGPIPCHSVRIQQRSWQTCVACVAGKGNGNRLPGQATRRRLGWLWWLWVEGGRKTIQQTQAHAHTRCAASNEGGRNANFNTRPFTRRPQPGITCLRCNANTALGYPTRPYAHGSHNCPATLDTQVGCSN